MTIAKIQSALREAQDHMPPIVLALHRANNQIREAYRQYRADMRAWVASRPNGQAWADVLDGELPPPVPAALRGITPPAPLVSAGDDAGEIYQSYLQR